MNNKKTVITDPSFDYLWDEIVKNNSSLVRGKVQFKDFPDWLPNTFLYDVEKTIEHKEVTYICDFSNPKSFFKQYDIMNTVLENCADKLRIIMPFFPWQKDRVDIRWEAITAKNIATILSSLPSWRTGKTSLHTFDMHALQVKWFFNLDKINVEMHTLMYAIREKIDTACTIIFPDDGAKKRFSQYFEWYDVVTCSKERKWDERIIKIEWDVKGKDTIIIDDLAQTGNTTIKTAHTLKEQWAKSVKGYVSHGVNPWNSHKKLAQELDEYIVTDSIPYNRERWEDTPKMTVLSIAKYINEKILLKS